MPVVTLGPGITPSGIPVRESDDVGTSNSA
jgi:hypothetical protein